MSLFQLCPGCRQVNPADTTTCAACGAGLGPHDGDTVRAGLPDAGAASVPSPGALWLEDLAPASAVRVEQASDEAPLVLDLDLREIGAATRPRGAAAGGAPPARAALPGRVQPSPQQALPTLRDPLTAPAVRPAEPLPRPTTPEALAAAKAAKRAAVRHALLAQLHGHTAGAEATHDVLVLDTDDEARLHLCAMLEGFGFRAHSAFDVAQATAQLAARRFEAVFLDLALDGSDGGAGAALCRWVKQPGAQLHRAAPALLLMSAHARPVEPVLARLAGADAFLAKPLGRGSVARALETCNVALPADARRA